jgi:putative pyoverdin transport system ATP-binding/permease protein
MFCAKIRSFERKDVVVLSYPEIDLKNLESSYLTGLLPWSGQIMRLAIDLIKSNLRDLSVVAIAGMLSGALGAIFLVVITRGLAAGKEDTRAMAILFVVVTVSILVLRQYHRHVATKVAATVSNQMRMRLMKLILSASIVQLERRGKSGLLTILTLDIDRVSSFVLALPLALSNVALVFGALLYLVYISGYALFLSVIAVVAAGVVLYLRAVKKSDPLYQKVWRQYSTIVGHYTDLVDGYKELKMDERLGESLTNDHVDPVAKRIKSLSIDANWMHSIGLNYGQAIIYVLVGLMIFVYPSYAAINSELILGYVIAIIYAAGPLEQVINVYPVFMRASVSLRNISELDDELSRAIDDINKPEQEIFLQTPQLDLVCNHLVYEHWQNGELRYVVGPIDFRLNSGEIVFIIGGNGSGKSTFVKMLCGLYVPTSGEIVLSGVTVDSSNRSNYRKKFSTVFSDFHVFSSAPSIHKIERICESDLAETFGFSEMLNETGLATKVERLSQGQRRRLALLLSILDDKDIYVFDEPGSDLDPVFKRVFYTELLPYLKKMGKSIAVVSHDDRYFNCADRIIHIDDGVVTERIDNTLKNDEPIVCNSYATDG